MDISIYRNLEDVKAKVRGENPKARWTTLDYRIGEEILTAGANVGIDLELEYWKQSVADGQIILTGETLWFSETADADRFQEEFVPSIIDRHKTQSFMKPFDDLYEFLAYARTGTPVMLQSIVPVRWQDFFASDEGEELLAGGVSVWFMLRAGCVGRVFYFAQEQSFGFENDADAILLAAYLAENDKQFGEELQDHIDQLPAQKARRKKQEEDEAVRKQAEWEYLRKMAEYMEKEADPNPWKSRPMWGIDPGNLPGYDLTSITIGDAYDPSTAPVSITPVRPRTLPKPGLPSYRDRPWPTDRYDLRDYVRRDPKTLRGAASASLRASLSASASLSGQADLADWETDA